MFELIFVVDHMDQLDQMYYDKQDVLKDFYTIQLNRYVRSTLIDSYYFEIPKINKENSDFVEIDEFYLQHRLLIEHRAYQDIDDNLEYNLMIVVILVFVQLQDQIIHHENVEPNEMLVLNRISIIKLKSTSKTLNFRMIFLFMLRII